MTTPTPPAVPGQLPDEAAIAAQLQAEAAAGNTGQTETDVNLVIAQLQATVAGLTQQMASLQADAVKGGVHPLLATAKMLRHHLADAEHRDSHAPAIQLADDLVDAAGNAVQSGNLEHVTGILKRLDRWSQRNPVPPGESYHARQAHQIIGWHLPDQVDAFVPAPRAAGIASSQPPARVVAGSVTG